jgi:hypothetical protein
MTRILLSLCAILSFSILANAQFNKGSILLGGTLSYSSSKSTTNNPTNNPELKISSGVFNISLGKAIRENAVFGITLSYSPYSQNNYYTYNTGTLDYSHNFYTIGVFYRLYKNLGKDFYLFGEGSVSYQGSVETGKDDAGVKQLTGSSNGGLINLIPGISYKVSKKLLLEISIPALFVAGYSSAKTNTGLIVYSKTNQFSISSSLDSNPLESLGIGFRLIL